MANIHIQFSSARRYRERVRAGDRETSLRVHNGYTNVVFWYVEMPGEGLWEHEAWQGEETVGSCIMKRGCAVCVRRCKGIALYLATVASSQYYVCIRT
jgi:hypothetical protein